MNDWNEHKTESPQILILSVIICVVFFDLVGVHLRLNPEIVLLLVDLMRFYYYFTFASCLI